LIEVGGQGAGGGVLEGEAFGVVGGETCYAVCGAAVEDACCESVSRWEAGKVGVKGNRPVFMLEE
jgi:hypothetical protein